MEKMIKLWDNYGNLMVSFSVNEVEYIESYCYIFNKNKLQRRGNDEI